jgi:photosystem II stability/assembly factor-like uncharacterized protein
MAIRNKRPNCACPGFAAAISLAALCALTPSTAFAVADLLETPARSTELAPASLLNDVTRAGDDERLIAVGERGHIIYSDDGGANWTQASVPVSVTLTGVDFGSASHGWAVGHSGVVLHSRDSGSSWTLKMNGVQAANLAIVGAQQEIEAMEQRLEMAAEDDVGDLEWALGDLMFGLENMQADLSVGPVNPFLDVWFEDAARGFVIGAYGMIFYTANGGIQWQDWAQKLDNGDKYHLNAITEIGGGALMIVGEAGQIHVSEDNGTTWDRRDSGYEGSLFGVTGTGNSGEALAFGLRGTVMHTTNNGQRWDQVHTGSSTTLNDGASAGERLVLVGNNGTLVIRDGASAAFRETLRADRLGLMGVVVNGPQSLLLVGEGGVVLMQGDAGLVKEGEEQGVVE